MKVIMTMKMLMMNVRIMMMDVRMMIVKNAMRSVRTEEVYNKECEQGNDEEIIENVATSCTCVESESDCEGDTSVSVQDSSMESSGEGMQLHFIDCIVLDDEKSDALIGVLCLEAGLQALHLRFPHLR